MPLAKEWASAFTKSYRNWGVISTSRLEGAHSQLKRHLANRLSSLKVLQDAIQKRVASQIMIYHEKLHKESKYGVTRYREHPLVAGIHMHMARKALETLWPQLQSAEQALREGTHLPACSKAFREQWGLPCRHVLYEMLRAQQPLGFGDFSRHWWLWEPEKSLLSREEVENRLTLDPLVIQRTKAAREEQERHGPPSQWPILSDKRRKRQNSDGGHDNSTRRDPSRWEGGHRQKKSKTPAKASIKRKPTTKELLERMEEMHGELQALRQSQEAPLSTPSRTPGTGITLRGIAPSMQIPMAPPAPSQQLPSLSNQVDWPHLPAPSLQTQAYGLHLPQLSRISPSNIVIREPPQNQSDHGT